MGTYVIMLQDTGTDKVMIMAKGKPGSGPEEEMTPALDMFIELLEHIHDITCGEFNPDSVQGGEFMQ